jgi:ankyrin repeat protein
MGQTASHLNGLGPQLIKAAKAGDADAVTELVSSNPQLLRYCTFRHLGPCHYAAKHNHVEVLQQLVAKAQEVEQLQWQKAAASSAKVHAQLFGTPAEPDLHSHQAHQPGLVKQMVTAATDRGVTPLMLAAEGGSVANVKLLLEKVGCAVALPAHVSSTTPAQITNGSPAVPELEHGCTYACSLRMSLQHCYGLFSLQRQNRTNS